MKIDSYKFGKIVIGEKIYRKDLIILHDNTIIHPWWRKKGHQLSFEDLNQIIKSKPELLIVGTGKFGIMTVPDELRKQISAEGIKLELEKTEKAVQIYNENAGKFKTAACLHLSC